MTLININKVVSVLPSPLEANAIYAVRSGVGFDLYFSDVTGAIAHKINSSGQNYSSDGVSYSKNDTYIFTAWPDVAGLNYLSQRRNLSDGADAGEATGPLPIPSDLSALTYN